MVDSTIGLAIGGAVSMGGEASVGSPELFKFHLILLVVVACVAFSSALVLQDVDVSDHPPGSVGDHEVRWII